MCHRALAFPLISEVFDTALQHSVLRPPLPPASLHRHAPYSDNLTELAKINLHSQTLSSLRILRNLAHLLKWRVK
jgi:hypothetical protein